MDLVENSSSEKWTWMGKRMGNVVRVWSNTKKTVDVVSDRAEI